MIIHAVVLPYNIEYLFYSTMFITVKHGYNICVQVLTVAPVSCYNRLNVIRKFIVVERRSRTAVGI